jgi:hypothetical protein
MTAPGVYLERATRSPAIQSIRTDVAAFIGYAERGVVMRPVKVELWQQFVTLFGGMVDYAYLANAVRGFFDNGGRACYIVRLADTTFERARAAVWSLPLTTTTHPPVMVITASYVYAAIAANLPPNTDFDLPYDAPGTWGNRLAVSILPQSLGIAMSSDAQPASGSSSFVDSLQGFSLGSYVRVIQDGAVQHHRTITAIDPVLREITWDQPLVSVDTERPMRVETVEFTVLISDDGQLVETLEDLSLSPEHPNYAPRQVQAHSQYIRLRIDVPDEVLPEGWWDAAAWDTVDRQALSGGRDGLNTITTQHYYDALTILARVEEVSMLAAPDLVLPPLQSDDDSSNLAPNEDPCKSLDTLPRGQIRGIVRDGNGNTRSPIAKVTIRYKSGASDSVTLLPVTTNYQGEFTLTGVPVGTVVLELQKEGFGTIEVATEARLSLPATPTEFLMNPLTRPMIFTNDEIYDVQQAMITQCEDVVHRKYRIALLDTPSDSRSIEQVQTWRRRYDSSYAALYYPWLAVDSDNQGEIRLVPPCGHVAGIIAHTDRQQGVHHAPANRLVQGIRALSDDTSDVLHGILNAQGINAIRTLPGRGMRIYGARTLSSDTSLRYLNARRLLLFIEESLERSTQWAVFEPNNAILRQALTIRIASFLNGLWRGGALVGDSPNAAYSVISNEENNPDFVREAGQMIVDIDLALTVPYEFVRIRLGRTEQAVEITE